MKANDFDAWRAHYDSMTFMEHKAFWERLEREHPQQDYTHKDEALEFLRRVGARKIVELGGWRGFSR